LTTKSQRKEAREKIFVEDKGKTDSSDFEYHKDMDESNSL
jgi:hypothetical protein